MKELSIEEKAKAYDEALERAKEYYDVDLDNTLSVYAKGTMEYLFPELKESEDERIRGRLINLVKMSNEVGGFALHKWEADEMIAWLEKQGENKPQRMISAEAKEAMYDKPDWSEEDKDFIYDTLSNLTELKDRYGEGYGKVGKCIDWLRTLKDRVQPKQVLRDTFGYEDGRQFGKNEVLGNPEKYGLQRCVKWSKSDKEISKEIDTIIHGTNSISDEVRKKLQDWLKSLNHQNTWMPSDEQLDALQYVYRNCNPPISDNLGWDSIRALEIMYQDLKKLKG